MIGLGIIGLGHWGANYLRIFSSLDGVRLAACADADPRALAKAKSAGSALATEDAESLFRMPEVQAVVIASPTHTHFALARAALEAGKHVLVEKPMALQTQEALVLAKTASAQRRILMVGHTFLYNPAVLALKALIDEGSLGRLYYLNASRTNLGPIRQDVNALLDLAPHDISMLLYLLGARPTTVAAHGASFLNAAREDVVFLTLRFPKNIVAQTHVSWLEPVKVRRLTVIGDRKMAVFDDADPAKPLRLFDKGVTLEPPPYADFGDFRMKIREGEETAPAVPFEEPLRNVCLAFLESVTTGRAPRSDASFGVDVARILDAAQASLGASGIPQETRFDT
jgi:predicted dehydrogenase